METRLSAAIRSLALVGVAFSAAGFGPGGCGQPTVVVPPDPPPAAACAGLDERACLAKAECEPAYTAPTCECPPCEKGGPCTCTCSPGPFAVCVERKTPPPACSELGEQACLARPDCRANYLAVATNDEGERCRSTRCLGPEEPVFAGCEPAACPDMMCMLWCPNGFLKDAAGCDTCACAPVACRQDDDCGWGERCDPATGTCGRGCLSDEECLAGEECVFTVDGCPPGASGCALLGVCQKKPVACTPGLDQTCNDDPAMSAFAGKCLPDGSCACAPGYQLNPATGRCGPAECPAVMCDLWCENGYETDPRGCPTCRCKPGNCSADSDCPIGERCELVDPCPAGDCKGQGTCVSAWCTSDAECGAGQVCLMSWTNWEGDAPRCGNPETRCLAPGVCAPAGSCRADLDCGPNGVCEKLLPDCPAGADCAASASEFGRCRPVEPGCASDAECAAGEYCSIVIPPDACPPGAYCPPPRGQCQPLPVGCTEDAQCAPGQRCFIRCGTPPVSGVCEDAGCADDSQCAAGEVCRADPKDPCSQPGVACLLPAKQICQPACAGLDQARCEARPDCSPVFEPACPVCDAVVFARCE